jgi:hypothetical protein
MWHKTSFPKEPSGLRKQAGAGIVSPRPQLEGSVVHSTHRTVIGTRGHFWCGRRRMPLCSLRVASWNRIVPILVFLFAFGSSGASLARRGWRIAR